MKRNDYKLLRRARKHKATIFFLDEAGFSSEPNLGRTYALKGESLERRIEADLAAIK